MLISFTLIFVFGVAAGLIFTSTGSGIDVE